MHRVDDEQRKIDERHYVVGADGVEHCHEQFPELDIDARYAHMQESDQGFVTCECLTAAELAKLERQNDQEWAEQDEEET